MKITSFAPIALLTLTAFAQTPQRPTARQIIERIQGHVGIPWTTPTVDTFKAGDPDTAVTGIAVTMMATLDVLEHAAAAGDNLIITHEPTFYNHQDDRASLQAQNDAVLSEKEAYIRDHRLVVWRFHDHWHQRRPDGILYGMVHALGWEAFQSADNPHLFTLPETTVAGLAESLKRKLGIKVLRAVGDPALKITRAAMLPGAAGSDVQIKMLERNDVQALIIGETREWETVEYVADASTEHKQKALLILGHIPSEQAGMEECARWLKTFVADVRVQFVPAAEPFWSPR
jgi:putative NIF3 family GTP cyclohydrolase 1 type 2